jgi:GNAT superfamily N-acetyltransferase
VRIRRIDINDAADFEAWSAVYDACQRHDMPQGPWWQRRQLRVLFESSSSYDVALFLADVDGRPVGIASAQLPLKDNTTLSEIDVRVLPDERRRGIGTALFAEAEKFGVENGRSQVLSEVTGSTGMESPPGRAFAGQHGLTLRITEVMRVQRAPFQLGRLGEFERAALPEADGYRLVSWRSPTPDEYLAEYARLAGRMSTDAPLGDLDYEPEAWDPDRVRDTEARRKRMGRQVWCTVAVAPDGTLAGMTEIAASADLADDDGDAFQNDTIVDPAHRGHRLGLLLKVANLRLLLADRPQATAIWTWNAEENSFMIAVNEKLGYVKAGWAAMYQRD